ncbi:LOW QUALITY PROTEIN: stonustoxin subunit beta-like [Alosa alosa]|uniref:LOW QUALITY PROTEIN: stonustoxin subunit beta-like n=1 Tax=Alosa alosa TaxID=278164 RepID=UPI0020152215|nr:LOW QUALITY PROTEIN: stonustoxin subunit beta-like [Alosa alosa]
MSNNKLEDEGVEELCVGLSDPKCQLQTLRLAGCNLTEKSYEIVASALQSANSPLRELDLSQNDLQESGEKLTSALQSPNCKLKTLRLAGCKLTEESCEAVASAVQHMVSLTELDLSDNHMNIAGIHLSSALKGGISCKLQTLRHARGELRKYACELTLDPNTACRFLSLSEGNKKVTRVSKEQPYPDHPERFDSPWPQVLCREGQSGRCYWEAEWSDGVVNIAVAYKSVQRKEKKDEWGFGLNEKEGSGFGRNAKSWRLLCSSNSYYALHNDKETAIPAPSSSRVGVYLDWPAGTLSFYSVSSNTLTHLHTFHSTFTKPLYPGFGVGYDSSVVLRQIT